MQSAQADCQICLVRIVCSCAAQNNRLLMSELDGVHAEGIFAVRHFVELILWPNEYGVINNIRGIVLVVLFPQEAALISFPPKLMNEKLTRLLTFM